MYEIWFDVAGVKIQLNTDSKSFYLFSKLNFSNHFIDATDKADISVSFMECGEVPNLESKFNCTISKNVFTNAEGELLACLPEYTSVSWFSNDSLLVRARYNRQLSLRRIVKKCLLRINPLKPDYFMLFRRLILFPTFYYLESKCGAAVIHGAAYIKNDKCIVLPGLANVGKTVTSLSAVLHDNARLLADNYLIIRDGLIYGVLELLRIDDSKLLSSLDKRSSVFQRNQRRFYQLNSSEVIRVAKPDKVVIPKLGVKQSMSISIHRAVDLILSSSNYVNELYYLSEVALLDYVTINDVSMVDSRRNSVYNAFQSCILREHSFDISIPPLENSRVLDDF